MKFDSDTEIKGQVEIEDILQPPEKMVAVSNVFAHARKYMSLNEQKAFVYALSQLKFTEEAQSDYIKLDKKVLAKILGINAEDYRHLSCNLFDELKEMPRHSYIEIDEKDLDLQSNGFLITSITRFKHIIRLRFNREYMGLFTNLSSDYITLWSSDIFKMGSRRSVKFYELLRSFSYSSHLESDGVYAYGWGVKAFKDLFGIPKDGEGSYMTKDGHFSRTHFEKRVLDPLCEDLAKCKMIHLIMQPDGKYYTKVKQGNRVSYYGFRWTVTKYPGVASAAEVKEIQEKVDADPRILKIAKDAVAGNKKKKVSKVPAYHGHNRDNVDIEALEKTLLSRSLPPTDTEQDDEQLPSQMDVYDFLEKK